MTRLEKITELYDQSYECLVQRSALQDAQSKLTSQQGLVFDQILALDFDDEEFERKHAHLNGQHTALHTAWMSVQKQMTELTDRSAELREKADKIVDSLQPKA